VEKENQRALPELSGFKVETEGAELKFVKEHKGEK
jgi:hypothetical protein